MAEFQAKTYMPTVYLLEHCNSEGFNFSCMEIAGLVEGLFCCHLPPLQASGEVTRDAVGGGTEGGLLSNTSRC